MDKIPALILAVILVIVPSPGLADTHGPAKGTLIIVGGGGKSTPVMKRFVARAGGQAAALVIIPSADDQPDPDPYSPKWRIFPTLGVKDLTVLHTTDRAKADSEAFTAPLRRATAVWLGGGRQWRLADAYLGTRVVKELTALLARGGVIGGSSAGATIQGSYLVRGAPEGNTVMMSPGHEQGFGFLQDSAIDQHWATRKRQPDLIPVIKAHPGLLGIGLDEDTAIVVTGDVFEVIGRSIVGIYDAASPTWQSPQPWQVLKVGDRFNLRERRVVK